VSRSKTPRPRRASEVADARARTAAALILEVLAGLRTPGEAAETLGLSLPRYYHLEERAIAGLTAACAPAPAITWRSSILVLSSSRRSTQSPA